MGTSSWTTSGRRTRSYTSSTRAGGPTSRETPSVLGTHDPTLDVSFLERELTYWLYGILEKNFSKMAKQAKLTGTKLEKMLHEKLTGLSITEPQILAAFRHAGLDADPTQWGEPELLKFCSSLQKISKPMIIAANKADIAPPENLERLKATGYPVIATSAEYELAMRRASKANLISYVPGSGAFEVADKSKLNANQLAALDKMSSWLKEHTSTGVQAILEDVVFKVLDLMVVYPVEDEHKWADKQGRILPTPT